MKKFIFPIFAICIYSPSFGACNHIYGPVPNGNKYLESQFSFTGKPAYLQCGGSTTNNAQCAQNNIVVGKDGYLYRCGDNIWTKLNDDDKELPLCKSNIRGDLVGLDPTYMGNNTQSKYIYLVKAHSDTEKTFYRCKYPRKDENDTRDKCILTCGDYYSGICNRDHAKDIIVKIVDKDNKAITSVSIKYPNLTASNNTINIATQKEEGDYTICLNEANNNLNVQISAQGYKSITKTVKQLLFQNNQQPITLQKNTPSNSTQSTSSLPGVATDQSFITTDPSNKLIITCENKGDINCKLPVGHNLTPLTDCTKLKKDLITETNVLYINATTFDRCSDQIGGNIDKSSCPAIQRVFLGERSYLLYCITNPNIEVRYTNEQTNAWSYEHKRCVGSWGEWKNGECDCSALDGAENVDNECLCTKNENQKYYNKLWSGCETLKDGVYQAGTKTKILGFWEDLSEINRANSCSPSGGKWSGNEKNECICSPTLNMEPDSNGYFCNCKEGYDYTDPMAKSNGCSLKSEINYDSNDISTGFQSSEQVAPTGTEEYECTKSGGDKYENGKCICDADKHLVEYNPDNAQGYSICKCVAGYKRDSKDNCVDAGDYETHEEFDSAAWRRDTENAYKHERDNAQSWENKGITAGSTLLTGEGAMKAAQAIAEQKADKKAEEQMAAYITTMGCEYGNGQQVNLGKEETLPGGNDLAKYYAEYKQLADKLKATKTALNLRPGIESEVLYDRAETGLYQYANTERQSGGFTSIARALMNPEGADAEQWNAQKAEVAQNLQTGTLLTAGGLATGAVGNYFVNRNHKPLELKRKLNTIKTRLENEYPEIFIPTPEEPVVEEEVIEEEPEKPADPVTITETETLKMPVSAAAFKSGHITLSTRGADALTSEANHINSDIQTDNKKITKIEIIAKGYADPDPINKDWVNGLTKEYTTEINQPLPQEYNGKIDTNDELAKARAEKVIQFLISNFSTELQNKVTNKISTGQEDSNCNKRSTKSEKEACRHVDVEITIETETTTTK